MLFDYRLQITSGASEADYLWCLSSDDFQPCLSPCCREVCGLAGEHLPGKDRSTSSDSGQGEDLEVKSQVKVLGPL